MLRGNFGGCSVIVRHFEPELRRIIRLRLTDPFLRRLFDSSDICQSVMANFLVRAGLGQYHFEEPRKLLNMLLTMARNAYADGQVRYRTALANLQTLTGNF